MNTFLRACDIDIGDPFILPVRDERRYYMYGTTARPQDKPGFHAYVSENLVEWRQAVPVFTPAPDFWAGHDFWAAEVHFHGGRYYLFGTCNSETACRGTQVFVADSPAGPFRPHSNGPVTPRGWGCLDGTLYIDEDRRPWTVFCHEWLQVGDGEMCALPLNPELDRAVGEPVLLFKAGECGWARTLKYGVTGKEGIVTDGPFLWRARNGHLLMLWSSYRNVEDPAVQGDGYVLAVARSRSGKLDGPWTHDPELLYGRHGGHGMLFHTFEGDLMLSLHTPNSGGPRHPALFHVEETAGGVLRIAGPHREERSSL